MTDHEPAGAAASRARAESPPVAGGEPDSVPRRVWWALVAMLAAAAMDLIDTTIVNVAAPAIRAELAATTAQIEWTVAGYALAFGVGLITGARLGDRYGRRPVFLVGVAGFVVTSSACGLAPNPSVLVAARVAQGLAAAVMIPQILTVIQVAIPTAQRPKAYAGYGATAAIGTVSGPLLGGLLISADLFGLGWRPIFLINVPIGLAALALASATLPDSRSPRAERLDLTGMVLLAAALLLVLYPLVEGPQSGRPGWTLGLLVAAVPTFAAFLGHQRRREIRDRAPLVALSLFARRGFTGGVIAQIALYAAVTGFFLVLALTLQAGQGFSALRTGLTFVAWSVGIAVSSVVSGGLAPRLGRQLTITGVAIMAIGMVVLLVAVTASEVRISSWALVPGLLIAGIGMGAVAPTLVDVSLRHVDTHDAGSASGIVATAGQLGGALGVAVLGALFFSALATNRGGPDYAGALTVVLYYEIAVLILAALAMLLIPSTTRADQTRAEGLDES